MMGRRSRTGQRRTRWRRSASLQNRMRSGEGGIPAGAPLAAPFGLWALVVGKEPGRSALEVLIAGEDFARPGCRG